MPQFKYIQNNFNGGELTPKMGGRTDLARYFTSVGRIINFIPTIFGDAERRYGTRFIAAAMGPSRLIPFQFSILQSYLLEFGNQRLRFITPSGQILSGGVPYEISTPYNTANDDLWDIKFVQQNDIMYLCHPNHPVMRLNRLAETNWVLTQPAFHPPAMDRFNTDVSEGTITLTPGATSGNGVTFTASAPVFIEGDVGKAIIAGEGVGFITAIGGATSIDGATGATRNQTATVDINDPFDSTSAIPAGSWFLFGSPNGYYSLGNPNGSLQWVDSSKLGVGGVQDAHTFQNFPTFGDPVPTVSEDFRASDLNRYVVSGGAVMKILNVFNSHHVSVQLFSSITETFAAPMGAIRALPISGGAWSIQDPAFDATKGFPRACAFFGSRLYLAGSAARATTVYGSVVGDYENFAKGSLDDEGVQFTEDSGQFDTTLWMSPFQGQLVTGNLAGEWAIGGGGALGANGAAITPSNVSTMVQSLYGSSRIQPILVESQLLYVQRNLKRLFEFSYSIYSAVFASKELTLFSAELNQSGFKELTYQQNPNRVLWVVCNDGELLGLTYKKDDDVWGWHRHTSGNGCPTDTVPSPDKFISSGVLPSLTAITDELWCIVNRHSCASVPPNQHILYVANKQRNSVAIFFIPADVGNVPPRYEIMGPLTDIDTPVCLSGQLLTATFLNNISVGCDNGVSPRICTFPTTVSGNVAPTTEIKGPFTQLAGLKSITVDPATGDIYAAATAGILKFPFGSNGNVAPTVLVPGVVCTGICYELQAVHRPLGSANPIVDGICAVDAGNSRIRTYYASDGVLAVTRIGFETRLHNSNVGVHGSPYFSDVAVVDNVSKSWIYTSPVEDESGHPSHTPWNRRPSLMASAHDWPAGVGNLLAVHTVAGGGPAQYLFTDDLGRISYSPRTSSLTNFPSPLFEPDNGPTNWQTAALYSGAGTGTMAFNVISQNGLYDSSLNWKTIVYITTTGGTQPTPPDGNWSLIGHSSTGIVNQWVFMRDVAAHPMPTTFSFTSSANDMHDAVLLVLPSSGNTESDIGSMVLNDIQFNSNGGTSSFTGPTVTTDSDNTIIITFFKQDPTGGVSAVSPPSVMTTGAFPDNTGGTIFNQDPIRNAQNSGLVAGMYDPGNAGSFNQTATGAASRAWVGASIAFKMVSSPPPFVISGPATTFDTTHLPSALFVGNAPAGITAPEYFIEKFEKGLNTDAASQADLGSPDTTVSGLAYLAGREVGIVGDGAYQGTVIVPNSGTITLPIQAAQVVEVGLLFTSTLEGLRLEMRGGMNSQGYLKRFAKLWVRVLNTLNIVVNGQRIPFRRPSDPMGVAVPLHSIDIDIMNLGGDRQTKWLIEQDQPFDCDVLAVFGDLLVGDN